MNLPFTLDLTSAPLAVAAPVFPEDGTIGSLIDFYGTVRGQENGDAISGLTYEAYAEMARHQFTRIVHELQLLHPVQAVAISHRLGAVPVGEPSIHLRVRSAHRAEGFAFATALLTRMKADVPIWKAVGSAPAS